MTLYKCKKLVDVHIFKAVLKNTGMSGCETFSEKTHSNSENHPGKSIQDIHASFGSEYDLTDSSGCQLFIYLFKVLKFSAIHLSFFQVTTNIS